MTSQTQKTKAKGPLMNTTAMRMTAMKTPVMMQDAYQDALRCKATPATQNERTRRSIKDQDELRSARRPRSRAAIVSFWSTCPLVKAIAVRVHENLPVHVDLDDLVHAGVLGLFDAASKFNPEKQVAFSSYAKHRIKGAILDSLRQLDWASRDLRRRHKQVEAATRELAATLQRTPTESEIAQKLGVDVERWRQMMVDLRSVGLISASIAHRRA